MFTLGLEHVDRLDKTLNDGSVATLMNSGFDRQQFCWIALASALFDSRSFVR